MTLRFSSCTHFFKFLQVIVISGYIATLQDELYTLERNHISKVKFLSFEIFFKHCPFLDGLNPIAIKGIAISLQALINISLGFISCSFQVDNVILSADLAVIFFKYQTSSSSINRSSNGLLILLLKVSAMWTYLSVVLILLCPISSFTILMSVPCSSR